MLNFFKRHSYTLFVIVLFACGGSSEKAFVKSPVDDLIRDMDKEKNFSIILYDMDMEDNTLSDDVFKHRYKVITVKDSTPSERITDWYKVNKGFFLQNENNMGMEIASKHEGKLSKVAAPPGYSNYVGNSQYGQWRTDSNGSSFWEFYGKYAMMSSMLGLVSNMVSRNHYYDYRDNYYGRQPYYGNMADGRPMYGTLSPHAERANPDFAKRTGGVSSFKERVQNRISKSSPAATSGSNNKSSGSSWFGGNKSSESKSSPSRPSSRPSRRRR